MESEYREYLEFLNKHMDSNTRQKEGRWIVDSKRVKADYIDIAKAESDLENDLKNLRQESMEQRNNAIFSEKPKISNSFIKKYQESLDQYSEKEQELQRYRSMMVLTGYQEKFDQLYTDLDGLFDKIKRINDKRRTGDDTDKDVWLKLKKTLSKMQKELDEYRSMSKKVENTINIATRQAKTETIKKIKELRKEIADTDWANLKSEYKKVYSELIEKSDQITELLSVIEKQRLNTFKFIKIDIEEIVRKSNSKKKKQSGGGTVSKFAPNASVLSPQELETRLHMLLSKYPGYKYEPDLFLDALEIMNTDTMFLDPNTIDTYLATYVKNKNTSEFRELYDNLPKELVNTILSNMYRASRGK